ncbi:MAG: Gfo/Idh/MocA family oxidoreductase [Planctomycetota bacterium]
MKESFAEGSPVGVAQIGLGYWGKNLARVFHRLGVLQTGVDASPERRDSFCESYPVASVYQSLGAALEDASVTAVAIATPPHTHAALAEAALTSGRDVYVEKPLCHDLDEALRLRELVEQSGRKLMVGHLLRYHPAFEALGSSVADGAVGEVRYIETRRTNLGLIPTERNVVWNFAPHDLSLILALAGERLPDTVRCVGHACIPDSACDAATLTLRFFDPAIVAQAYVGWLNPIKEARLSVAGSDGAIVFDDTRPWGEKLRRFDGHRPDYDPRLGPAPRPEPAYVAVPEGEPLLAEASHFVECCRHRQTPRTDVGEGLRVVAVLDAAQRSLDAGGDEIRPERD